MQYWNKLLNIEKNKMKIEAIYNMAQNKVKILNSVRIYQFRIKFRYRIINIFPLNKNQELEKKYFVLGTNIQKKFSRVFD